MPTNDDRRKAALLSAVSMLGLSLGVSLSVEPGSATAADPGSVQQKVEANHIKGEGKQIKLQGQQIKGESQQIKLKGEQIKGESQQIKLQGQQIKGESQQHKVQSDQVKLKGN
jgi:hypothetical protein